MSRTSPRFFGLVLLAVALCVLFPPRKLRDEPSERTDRGFLFSGQLYRDARFRDASVDLSHLGLEVAFVLLVAGGFALLLPAPPPPRPWLHPRAGRTPNHGAAANGPVDAPRGSDAA